MLKIKDKDGKVLYNVSDEATEPEPTEEGLQLKKEEAEEKEKKDLTNARI